ncbi:MFS transporter [Glutamicibacter nicotianae]|uniref:MFS transporter n=1 Tax=Glutamicibacter nicotianae TaxID=37929 RepID=UPI001FCA1D0D|nr:MFS transporter [Glutamicibacter nicotianae]
MYLSLSDWTSRKAAGPGRAQDVAFKASPTVIALGMVSLLTDISSESVAAVLPLYITSALGLSMVAYGFFEGMNQSISSVVRIAAGYAADRSNRPKPIAAAGYGLSMAARAGLLFATGFGGILAVIGLDRIGKGIRTAPRDAMIQHASQPEHLARSFGLHRLLDTVGATLGPLLAFVVLLLVPGDYRTVFVISLAAAVLGVAVLALVVPDRRLDAPAPSGPEDDGQPAGAPSPKLRVLVRGPLGRVLLAAGFLGLLTIGDGFIYLALLEQGQLDARWFPLMFVGTNVFFLLLAVPMGRLADKTSRAGIFVLGHLALAGAYLCAGAGNSLVFVLLALALLGVFYAATDGVLAALAGQLSPAGSTSTAIGTAQTVVAVARLVASTGFGVLWILLGSTGAMLIAAGLLLVLVPAAWMLVLRPGNRPAPRRRAA